MTTYISYGLYSSLLTFRSVSESKISTLKDFFDVTKVVRRIFRIREPILILKNIYSYSWKILQDEEALYPYIKGYLKKIKGKKLKFNTQKSKFPKRKILRYQEVSQ